MHTVHIDQMNARIETVGGKLVVRSNGERKATLPLRLIERVVITSQAHLSSGLLAKLAEQGAGVLLAPRSYAAARPVHLLARPCDASLRMAQVDAARDPETAAGIASHLLTSKLTGHLALLDEEPGNRLIAASARSRACKTIGGIIEKLDAGGHDLPALRGLEGAAAAAFFAAWGECFPAALGFVGRNRRPPQDPVNVCLSIGYTLAHHETLCAVAAQGFEPSIGFLHDLHPGRDSLACDLVEPLRPLVERWVCKLFLEGGLTADHFSIRHGGCLAGKAGRRLIYGSYEETAADGVRTSCRVLARWLRGTVLRKTKDCRTTSPDAENEL